MELYDLPAGKSFRGIAVTRDPSEGVKPRTTPVSRAGETEAQLHIGWGAYVARRLRASDAGPLSVPDQQSDKTPPRVSSGKQD